MIHASRHEILLAFAAQIIEDRGPFAFRHIVERLGSAVLEQDAAEIAFWKAVAVQYHSLSPTDERDLQAA